MSERRVVPYTYAFTIESAESPPSAASDGIDVGGRRQATVVLSALSSTSSLTLTLQIRVSPDKGATWVHARSEDIVVDNENPDVYGPWNLRDFTRFAAIIDGFEAGTGRSIDKLICVS